jgi:hypothetical protein
LRVTALLPSVVSVLDALHDLNARVERWADAHPVAWTVFAAVLTGGTLAATATASGNAPLLPDAVAMGALFAATYVTMEAVFAWR